MTKHERESLHEAFQLYIKESFTAIDCFNVYTLDRDENGSYTNMSVCMEFPIFVRGWKTGRKYKASRRRTL